MDVPTGALADEPWREAADVQYDGDYWAFCTFLVCKQEGGESTDVDDPAGAQAAG